MNYSYGMWRKFKFMNNNNDKIMCISEEIKNELERYVEFLINLDESCYQPMILFLCDNKKMFKRIFIPYHLISIKNTINTIMFSISNHYFLDAFCLIRKLCDDLFQYLYICDVCNNYNLNMKKTDEIIAITKRINGDKLTYSQKKLFEFKNYFAYLCKNNNINDIIKTIFDDGVEEIRSNLNDYIHGNSYSHLLANDRFNNYLKDVKKEAITLVRKIVDFFGFSLCFISPLFLSASDYMDCLELGREPEEGSQYYLAPCFNDFFKCEFLNYSGLERYILKNTSIKMYD